MDINGDLKIIRENSKIPANESLGYYELKKESHCLAKDTQIIRSEKQAKFQCLQHPRELATNRTRL